MKGGVTIRSRSRNRSRTPELMQPWVRDLQVGQRYRFQTRDNRVPITGTYDGREGRNFIFTVDGHRTMFPISLINPIPHNPHGRGLAALVPAFVHITNGGLRRKKKNTRKVYRNRNSY